MWYILKLQRIIPTANIFLAQMISLLGLWGPKGYSGGQECYLYKIQLLEQIQCSKRTLLKTICGSWKLAR